MNIYFKVLFTNKAWERHFTTSRGIIHTKACEYVFTIYLACKYIQRKNQRVGSIAHCCRPPCISRFIMQKRQ